jgi:NADPH:quinone reductase-like Zn-dependent oxidoreductase
LSKALFWHCSRGGFRAVFADRPVKRKTVYVPSGTGRVGAYAVQFADGAPRVIASVSGERRKKRCAHELSADFVLDRQRTISQRRSRIDQ